MVKWKLVFTKQSQKDAKKITSSGLKSKVELLLNILKENPYQNPPSYEKLIGEIKGAYSHRINIQDRLIYQIIDKQNIIKIIRMWTHYE